MHTPHHGGFWIPVKNEQLVIKSSQRFPGDFPYSKCPIAMVDHPVINWPQNPWPVSLSDLHRPEALNEAWDGDGRLPELWLFDIHQVAADSICLMSE